MFEISQHPHLPLLLQDITLLLCQNYHFDSHLLQQLSNICYQLNNTGKDQSQYDMLKALELSFDEFAKIKEYFDEIGILFASTADEPECLEFLLDIGMPFIKIGSDGIGNIPFLRYVGEKKCPVILSTGMSTLAR